MGAVPNSAAAEICTIRESMFWTDGQTAIEGTVCFKIEAIGRNMPGESGQGHRENQEKEIYSM